MSDRCRECDNNAHEKCDGIERVIDQDGHSKYMCGCYCNSERIKEPCRHCEGQGFKWVTSQTKNRGRKHPDQVGEPE